MRTTQNAPIVRISQKQYTRIAADREREGEDERVADPDGALYSRQADDQEHEPGDHLDDLPDPDLRGR